MKYIIVSMRDEPAQVFGAPVCEVNEEVARRNFRYGMANAKDVRSFRPEDFSLWQIATYDDTNGVITPEVPVLLERGVIQ